MRLRCLLIWLLSESDIDALFITCHVLHNMLLTFDGRDVSYENPATWTRADGTDDVEDDEPSSNQGNKVQRRAEASVDKTYVWSGPQDAGITDEDPVDVNFTSLREALVQHFDYHCEHNEIVWLQRT